MSENHIRLTRRRALGGLVTIGIGSAATGVGTFAYFSDEETSEGNTLSTGTLSLDDGDDTDGSADETFTAGFTASNLAPGEGMDSPFEATLQNTGSLDGSLDIDVSITEGEDSDGIGDVLNVDEFTVDSDDALSSFDDTPTLTAVADLTGEGDGTEAVQDVQLAADAETTLSFSVSMQTSAGNEYQGASVDVSFDFELNQTDSQ